MDIWQATLDDRFDCRVIRLNEAHGRLTVIDNTDQAVLLEQEVTLSYGAAFGPDIADVEQWQELCVDAVDRR